MAEFVVSCSEAETKTINTGTAYAAAHKYAEKELKDDAKDDDEFDLEVLERSTGKITLYTVRAQVSTMWVVTKKIKGEGAAS